MFRLLALFAFVQTSKTEPVCARTKEIPVGVYQTPVGYNKFVTLTRVGESPYVQVGFAGGFGDEDLEEDVKAQPYKDILVGSMHVEVMSDCSLKIVGESSGEVWWNIFYVLSDFYGVYVGVEGLRGKYSASDAKIILGGWVEFDKVA